MIIIGADHAGFELKNIIIEYFKEKNIKYSDVTDYDKNLNDDYTDVAIEVCKNVLKNEGNLGIAICGTGIGISVACNKIKRIIATPCFDEYTARMVKRDNNSNVLCLGGRLEYSKNKEDVLNIINVYINTPFEGERHLRRVNKIRDMEDVFGKKLWE
ncbi:MAG: RpiB/LacA/LacB family sugar-phosphate isomerase [Clostridia bacterium]|nr:RpiB/LacA/LacB family sugar-phosphate isomerase [Clostridia bacterium]MDD4386320.1 RpiB/LacA/LacB family sugar-phosphate isomerase [Clostridia bacterium]